MTATEQLQSFMRTVARFALASGETAPEWDDLAEDVQAAWQAAFLHIVRYMEGDEQAGATYGSVGADANRVFQEVIVAGGYQTAAVPWDKLGDPERLTWSCLVRHCANLLVFDPEEDGALDRHEQRIADFFTVKLADLGLPEAEAEARRQARDQDEERPEPAA